MIKKITVGLLFLILATCGLIAGAKVSAQGDGTEQNPYRIRTEEDVAFLLQLGSDLLASHIRLETDVDLDGYSWIPIGTASNPFQGSFDGGSYVISNLFVDRSDYDYAGLFGVIGNDAIVQNVTLENAVVNGFHQTGILAGENRGFIINSSSIGSDSVLNGRLNVGGLVGKNVGTIEKSSASAKVNGRANVGGLAGWNEGTILYSYATGDVATNDSTVFGNSAGGLVGHNEKANSTIHHSYATGNVEGKTNVGGLLGLLRAGTVHTSYATGDIVNSTVGSPQGTWNSYGGVVGHVSGGQLYHTFATGKPTGPNDVGGVVGNISGGIVRDSHWNTSAIGSGAGKGSASNLIGLTFDLMKHEENFSRLEFNDSWAILEGLGTPYLKHPAAIAADLRGIASMPNGGNLKITGSINNKSDSLTHFRLHIMLSNDNGMIAEMITQETVEHGEWQDIEIHPDDFNWVVGGYADLIPGEFTAWVRALTDSRGTEAISSIGAPDTPANLRAVAGDRSVALFWDAALDAEYYNIYQYKGTGTPGDPADPDDASNWEKVVENVKETRLSVGGLANGGVYWFAVRAVNAADISGYSTIKSARPLAVVETVESFSFAVPKGTVFNDVGLPEQIEVRLSDGRILELDVQWDIGIPPYEPGVARSYVFTGEPLNIPADAHNPQSLRAEAIINVVPGNDAQLSGITLNGNSLPEFVPIQLYYDIYVPYTQTNVTVTAMTYDPEASFTISGTPNRLDIGTNPIEIRVVAENNQDESLYTLNIIRAEGVPMWPEDSLLDVVEATPTSVKLVWPQAEDELGAASYTIRIHESDQVYRVDGSQLSYVVTGLANKTKYTFTVTALNADGRISESLTASTVTPDYPPSPPSSGGFVPPVLKPTLIVNALGGKFELGGVMIEFPSMATEQAIQIMLEIIGMGKNVAVPEGAILVSELFEITKNRDGNFNEPITITMPFERKKVDLDRMAPAIYWLDEQRNIWVRLDNIRVDHVNGYISGDIYHFAKFAVFASEIEEKVEPVTLLDIKNHWANAVIQQSVDKGIIKGYPDRTFRPDQPVTRAEFAVMLTNLIGASGDREELSFTDKEQIGSWAFEAISLAVSAGWIQGYSDGSFRPNEYITRAEMVVMIARALRKPIEPAEKTYFSDDADIPEWAKNATEAARRLGIVQGRGGNRFVPNDSASRAEAATILLRLAEIE